LHEQRYSTAGKNVMKELGRYKILEEIGQGGFAIVYRAHDAELERLLALKELRPALLPDTEWVKGFKRRARTIAGLDRPGIVTIMKDTPCTSHFL
jgi:serine/threonine-protein kinase